MAKGHFVITDISGYTQFLTQTELEHAHEILQALFKAQMEQITPPFVISSFRGDAIVMYIPDTSYIRPQSVLEALENLYIAFLSTLEQMQYHTTCTCRACREMSLLDLKMVVHYGSYIVQQMGDREELLGADVIAPHRMLKNYVIEETGIKSYALFSEAAVDALELQNYCRELHNYSESYEHLGEVNMMVHDLRTAWEKEKDRRRKAVTREEAWVIYEADVTAPPSLVWDYLTTPNLKAELMGIDLSKRVDNLGGRVREEAEFHCAHGDLMYDYKIVDWKPFEYFTCEATDSATGLEYYETYHFIPTETGTHFLNCVSKPEGEIPEGAQKLIQDFWNQVFDGLKPYVEEDIARGKVIVTPSTKPEQEDQIGVSA